MLAYLTRKIQTENIEKDAPSRHFGKLLPLTNNLTITDHYSSETGDTLQMQLGLIVIFTFFAKTAFELETCVESARHKWNWCHCDELLVVEKP
jgi:hypothetical protein